jgi:hypothetical protein
MAKRGKKGKKHMPVFVNRNGSNTVNLPQTSNWSISSSSPGALVPSGNFITTTSNGSQWIINPSTQSFSNILSTVKDLRNHLFMVEIGHYDVPVVTALIRSIEFKDEKLFISFLLDDKDMIREAFSEYHSFRLSYLNTKGEVEETYQIQTDPLAEAKYILPDVRHDLSDLPNWKLVWSPYTVTRVVKEDKDD